MCCNNDDDDDDDHREFRTEDSNSNDNAKYQYELNEDKMYLCCINFDVFFDILCQMTTWHFQIWSSDHNTSL